jgi:AbiV family abortive infection protein
LVSNAALLAKEGCLSSARFLITTAREELAKSYLLVDTCRLDFKKHKTVLHMMCKAFYSHIDKHAYIELLEIDRPLIDSMTKAKGLWDVAVQRWWPGNCEYPDMPHDTYFDRQAPIYVDYGEHERCWLVPEDANQVAYFILHDRISNTKKLVDLWRKADSDGLCSSHVLAIINSIFKSQYFNESTDIKELELIYKKIAQLVEECNIPIESFWASPLVRIPCYHFVLSHK